MRGRIVDAARDQANKGVTGSMEGHASMDMSMDMSMPGDGTLWQRLFSRAGLRSRSFGGEATNSPTATPCR